MPISELELTNRKFNELTSKYRDLLQQENVLVARSSAVETLQVSGHVYLVRFPTLCDLRSFKIPLCVNSSVQNSLKMKRNKNKFLFSEVLKSNSRGNFYSN